MRGPGRLRDLCRHRRGHGDQHRRVRRRDLPRWRAVQHQRDDPGCGRQPDDEHHPGRRRARRRCRRCRSSRPSPTRPRSPTRRCTSCRRTRRSVSATRARRRPALRPTSSPAPTAPGPRPCSSGQAGGTLTQLGANVTNAVAVVTDNCPAGLGFVARFAGVTLPDSAQNADGTLLTATRLQVRVADGINPSSIGQSSNVDVWVDPVAPDAQPDVAREPVRQLPAVADDGDADPDVQRRERPRRPAGRRTARRPTRTPRPRSRAASRRSRRSTSIRARATSRASASDPAGNVTDAGARTRAP